MRRPFFRKQTKCWYVKDSDGQFIRLDPDEQVAHKLWTGMLEAGTYKNPDATFYAVCQAWLTEFENRVSTLKYQDAVRVLKSFCDHCGDNLKIADVSAGKVLGWLDANNWSQDRRADCTRFVRRVVRWAFTRGWTKTNLLDDLRVKSGKPRSKVVLPDQQKKMIEDCFSRNSSKPLALVLIALHHTGARPGSIRTVRKSDVSPDGCFWVMKQHKTEHVTGSPLTISLTPCMQTLTRILASHRQEELFLNSRGGPWTKDAIVCAIRRLRERLGLKDVIAYHYRHTFATDALLAGQDIPTVAAFLGHTTPEMVMRVYSHLNLDKKHLIDKMNKLAQDKTLNRQ